MQARTQIGIFAIIAVAVLTLFIVNAVGVFVDGSHIGTEENIDFVAGANMTITGTENPGTDTVTITFASAAGTSTPSGAVTSTIFDLADVFQTGATSSGQIIVMGAAQFTNVNVGGDATSTVAGVFTIGTSTRLRADPADCGAGDFANAIDAVGDLTCATPAGGVATSSIFDLADVFLTAPTSTGHFIMVTSTPAQLTNRAVTVFGGQGIDINSGESANISTNPTWSFEPSELDALTWHDGSLGSFTWVWNVTTNDPSILFGNNIVNVTAGTLQQGGLDVELDSHGSEHDIDDDVVPYYGVVRDEGTDLTRRRNINFTGAGVNCVDVGGTTSTDCTIAGGVGGGSVSTEEDNVLVLATTTTYDFGSCFDVTDVGGNEADITFDFTESCGELTNLTDVNLSATSSAQILLSDGQWVNVTLSGDATLATSGALTVGTSTRLRADPTDCGANTFATSIDPEGDLTCTSIDISDDTNLGVSGTLLDLTGDTLSINEGTLTDNNLCDFESTGSQLECTTNTKAELEGIITDIADFAEADGDTFTGVHDFGGATSLELPLCGTTSVDGQICSGTATSTAQLVWFHGEQHVLSATTSKGLLLFAATSTDDFALWNTDQNIIVTKACFLSEGGVWVGDLSFFDLNGNSGATLLSGDLTTVAGTRGCTGESGEPTMTETTVEAQSWVGIDTTSSATNDRLHITFWYKLIL